MKIALLLIISNTFNLSFEYRASSPVLLYPYNYAVSDTSPLCNLSNPAYLPLWNSLYINIDYSKPFLMEELNSGSIRTGYGFNNFGMQFSWNRFGIKEYNEDIIEGIFGYKPWNFFSAGIGISYYRINIDTDDIKFKYAITDFKFSALCTPVGWISFGYLLENINSMIEPSEKREDFLYPNQSAGLGIKPAKGITFTWNINKTYYDYINSFSATTNLLPCLSLKGGYSRETSSYSMAMVFVYGNIFVSYGLSHHTYLGSTHKVGITLSTDTYLFEEVSYNKSLFKRRLPEKKKNININECTRQEIVDSGLFQEEIAERIMKYRDTIGPVTEKSLIQIGMTEKELAEKREYIKGMADDEQIRIRQAANKTYSRDYRNRSKSGYDIDTRKLLFQKLLENNINAESALDIADHAKNSSKKEILILISELTDIDEEKKKIIIKICTDLL